MWQRQIQRRVLHLRAESVAEEAQDRRGLRVVHDHEVVLTVEEQRVVEDLLEVDLLHLRRPVEVGALERVVHALGDAEELVAPLHDLPVGVDADTPEQRDVRREQLGHPAAVGRGVEMEDLGATKRLGEPEDLVHDLDSDRAGVVGAAAFRGGARVRARSTPVVGMAAAGGAGLVRGSIYRLMRTALVCPDKFRGTLTAAEAAAAMAAGLRAAGFDEIRELPLADGGDGTLDALLASRGGSRRNAVVTGPLGDPVEAEWGLLPGRARGRRDGPRERSTRSSTVATTRSARRPAAPASSSQWRSAAVRDASSSVSAGARAPTEGLPRSRRSGGRRVRFRSPSRAT